MWDLGACGGFCFYLLLVKVESGIGFRCVIKCVAGLWCGVMVLLMVG